MAIVTQENISKLYLATFGRALDSLGLEYWTNTGAYSNGTGSSIETIEELSQNFSLQEEYIKKYPSTTTDSEFINAIYQNLFQRDSDVDGLAYWLKELESGVISRDKAILAIVNGAKGDDLSLITDRSNTALSLALSTHLTEEVAKSDQVSNLIRLSKTNDSVDTLSYLYTPGVYEVSSFSTWDSSLDTITFSFNSTIPNDYYTYEENGEKILIDGWKELTADQKYATRSIIDELNKLINVNLQEVSSGGMINFNIVQTDSNVSGFAFLPGENYSFYGDVFLSDAFNTQADSFGLGVGENGWLTIAHELGHALGLKHTFEAPNILSSDLDDINHSIMSYTEVNSYIPVFSFSSTKIFLDYENVFPELYSIYDVAALQFAYGVNENTNLENNIYTTKYTDYKIQTIWEAGGIDTIDLSDTIGKNTIDLNPGTLNTADQYSLDQVISLHQDIAIENSKSQHTSWIALKITELYNDNNLYTGIDNLAIATGTLIENLYTGSANDTVTDNKVNNYIATSFGDDHIYLGNGGSDKIDGGDGYDTIHLNTSKEEVEFILLYEDNYVLSSQNFAAEFTGIESITFLDNISYSIEVLIA